MWFWAGGYSDVILVSVTRSRICNPIVRVTFVCLGGVAAFVPDQGVVGVV